MKKGAIFSDDRLYRYTLWRVWDEGKSAAMFVGLNPSTADENRDDSTVAKCIRYAQQWGYGGLIMANIFGYRSTDRSALRNVADPIGPENNHHLLSASKSAGIVIAAWGNDGAYFGRGKDVRKILPGLHCLKFNKSGEPAHPLYLSASLKPILFLERTHG